MENPWTIGLEPCVAWMATLSVPATPEHGDWLRTALTRGEDLGVYRVGDVPDIGYRRDTHRGLMECVQAHPEAPIGPLFFGLRHTATTRVAFHDSAGTVVEEYVDDLGIALAPFETPVRHRPPLEIRAYRWRSEVSVVVRTYSDIWLPWTAASHDPDSPAPGFGDNRVLAGRHTPRLNAFLAALREATGGLGGRWELDRDALDRDAAPQVDDRGVLLDAAYPRPGWAAQ